MSYVFTQSVLSLSVTVPLAGVVGLFVGSFLNVVIYRAPLGLSVSTPRSFCPTCDRQLSWFENVPVASWVVLRARCRTCHQPISPRYPLVELATGGAFALVTWGWHGTIVSAAYCILAAAMIAVALIEFGGKRSPLAISAIGTVIALPIIVIGAGWHHHWGVVAGSLLGTAVASLIYGYLRTKDPECADPRGLGRSGLIIAGCWVGGLGPTPTAVGVGSWIIVYFVCMVGAWSMVRRRPEAGDHATTGVLVLDPLLAVPLVTALAIAMAASLIAAG
jgi:prepilin signal peptidase PulO-like enzyme (type II secretory pathway)